MNIPGFGIYDDATVCPECGADFNRDHSTEFEGGDFVEYVECFGAKPHRWRVFDVHRDRSVWFYQVSGPVSHEEPG